MKVETDKLEEKAPKTTLLKSGQSFFRVVYVHLFIVVLNWADS